MAVLMHATSQSNICRHTAWCDNKHGVRIVLKQTPMHSACGTEVTQMHCACCTEVTECTALFCEAKRAKPMHCACGTELTCAHCACCRGQMWCPPCTVPLASCQLRFLSRHMHAGIHSSMRTSRHTPWSAGSWPRNPGSQWKPSHRVGTNQAKAQAYTQADTHLGVQDLGQRVPVLSGGLHIQWADNGSLRSLACTRDQRSHQRILAHPKQLGCGAIVQVCACVV